MAPVTFNLPDYYRGDTWLGGNMGPASIDGAAPTTTLVSARLQFRDFDGVLGYELNTTPAEGKGTISITNAASWTIAFPKQILYGLNTGKWDYDIELVDSEGTKRTVYKGYIKVIGDVSYDD